MRRRRSSFSMPGAMIGALVAVLFVRAFGPELLRYLRITQM